MNRRVIPAVLATVVLSACGGGSGGGLAPSPVKPTTPLASSSSAKISIAIPNSPAGITTRRRAFVGSDVQGATVAVSATGSTGTPTTTAFDLSSASALCATSANGRVCTITVTAPIGNDTFTITTYSQAPVNGAIPAAAAVLGTDTVTETIDSGTTAPTISVFVQGVIAGFGTINPLMTLPADGAAQNVALSLDPVDFSNQPIVAGTNDPFSNPITVTLAEHGGTNVTQLTVNGVAVGTSATLTQSSQTLGIAYTGGGSTGYYATVTLTASGVTSSQFSFAPLYITSTSPIYMPYSVAFTGTGQTATVTASEAAGSNTYTAAVIPACSGDASASAPSGTTAASTVTITSGSTAVTGAQDCGVAITDSLNTTLTVNFTNTVSGGSVEIGGIDEYSIPGSAGPEPIVVGSDGRLYAGETAGTHIDALTTGGTLTQYSISPHMAVAEVAGPDGNIWFCDGSNVLGKMTTSGTVSFYTVGASSLNALTIGPDGNIWAIDQNSSPQAVVDISLQGSVINAYNVGNVGDTLTALTANTNVVFVADPNADMIYTVSTSGAVTPLLTLTTGNNTQGMTCCVNGSFYFTESGANELGISTYSAGTSSQTPMGASYTPRQITIGADGNLWFAAPGTNSIVLYDFSNTSFVAHAIPTSGAYPIGIATGPDGRIWFTEFSSSKIGALTP